MFRSAGLGGRLVSGHTHTLIHVLHYTLILVYTHTHTADGAGWPSGTAASVSLEKVGRGESRTHSPLLRSLCYAVHSGLQGQLSVCKT